jgi:hypothetical protein
VNVIERLHAETIAGQEELPRAAVPDGEGEHAAQVVDAALPMLVVQVHDDFRVAARGEHVTAGLELGAVLGVVVDLSVEDDLQRTVRVGHGLVSRGEVDDAEAAVREADGPVDEDAGIVGTAVPQDVAHSQERRRVHVARAMSRQGDAANAAHGCNAASDREARRARARRAP